MFQGFHAADSSTINDIKYGRNSTSTSTTQCQSLSPCQPLLVRNLLAIRCDQRLNMFRCQKNNGQISQKLIEKAVSWIEITGYTKNLRFDTIILSIGLFYASLNNIEIQKKTLQATICSCLLLACKMTSGVQLTMSDVLVLIDNRQRAKKILEQQKKILLALDFNLHFEFPILIYLMQEIGDEQYIEKVKFLLQILLLKQSSILYDIQKMQQILKLCQKRQLCQCNKLAIKINKMLKKSSCQHLISKYKAKFNVNSFIIYNDDVSSFI